MLPDGPRLTVDAVILDPRRGVVLVRRGHPPFAGRWALPGGFVEADESCPDACVREVREETGLQVDVLELVGVFSGPGRDPRGPVASVVYRCGISGGTLTAGDDAADACFFASLDGIELAFDHHQILQAAGVG